MREDAERLGHFHRVNQGTQILLRLKYQEMLRDGAPLPSFDEIEFRSYSQNGEDGILLFIFSLIGTTSKKAVEICAGSGMECNSANLIINHGWRGLLFDGSEENIRAGRDFYARHKDTLINPPRLVHSWITRANVDDLISSHGFEGEIDLLSIDLDGNDYWIWKAIKCISPRVVVVEHNSLALAERAITIPYSEDFVADLTGGPPYYLGASLPAFVKLGKEKGYHLVGGERLGFNAFFVRSDIQLLPEMPAAALLRPTERTAEFERAVADILSSREFVDV